MFMLINASELSLRGSGTKMLCSSHSFQIVFLGVLGSGAMSIVKFSIRVSSSSVCEHTPLGVGGECLYVKRGDKVGGGVSRLVAK